MEVPQCGPGDSSMGQEAPKRRRDSPGLLSGGNHSAGCVLTRNPAPHCPAPASGHPGTDIPISPEVRECSSCKPGSKDKLHGLLKKKRLL